MAYTNPMKIANGLALDFSVEAAGGSDAFLMKGADGTVTQTSSVPASRVSSGGDLSEAVSSVLTISGSGVLLSNGTIQVKQAGAGQAGYLSSADWTTFNNKLTSALQSGRIFVGNGSNIATGVDVTGDIGIDNAGVVSISAGVIVNADVHAAAAIAVNKLAAMSASLAVATDGSGFITTVAGVTTTKLGYLTNVTSDLQGQLDTTNQRIVGIQVSSEVLSPGAGQHQYAIIWDNTNSRWALSASGGGGTLTGPGSSTDNAIARWNGTGGDAVQDSGVVIDDSNNVTGVASILIGTAGLKLYDTDASHSLGIVVGSNLTADRTLSIVTGDSNRSITLSGSPTLDDWFDQSVKTTADPLFNSVTVSNASGLHILDSDSSHDLILTTGSNLTADRTLTINTGDVSYTVTVNTSGTFYITGGTDVALADGGTGATLSDPHHDAIFVWDDTAGLTRLAAFGSGISYNTYTNTITATGSSSGHVIENSGTPLTNRANLNFRNGLTAADNNPDTDVYLGGTIDTPISMTIADVDWSIDLNNGGDPGTLKFYDNSVGTTWTFAISGSSGIRYEKLSGSVLPGYADDYSASFTDRHWVDKGYVVSLTDLAWKVNSGGTLTATNTITSNAANRLNFTSTFTAGSSGQYFANYTGTLTHDGVAADSLTFVKINPTITTNANNQISIGQDIDITFNGTGSGIKYIGQRIVSGGLLLGTTWLGTPTLANAGIQVRKAHAGTTAGLLVENSTSGTTSAITVTLTNNATSTADLIFTASNWTATAVRATGLALLNGGAGGVSLVASNAAGAVSFATGGSATSNTRLTINENGLFTFTQAAQSSTNTFQTFTQAVHTGGSPVGLLWTGGAHTTLAASTEAIDINYNLARTVQFATGALTTQRTFVIQAPTYGFVGSSTITDAYTFYVTGNPAAGTNATITRSWTAGFGGNVFIGSGTPTTGSILLELQSTTRSLLLTRVTADSNIATKVDGMFWYNSTDVRFKGAVSGIVNTFLTISESSHIASVGHANQGGTIRYFDAIGSQPNIDIYLDAKGSGSIVTTPKLLVYNILGDGSTISIDPANGLIKASKGSATSQNLTITAFDGFAGATSGTDLVLAGGNGLASGNTNGGGVRIDSGTPNSSGLYSNVGIFITPVAATWQKAIIIGNSVAQDTVGIANATVLYSKDVSASSELFVMDEAGNETQLSPHFFGDIPGGASEDMAWSYYSNNYHYKKSINVDMLAVVRAVEDLYEKMTGEKKNLAFIKNL